MEIHVPRPFTAERPAVAYTHNSFTDNINDHPLGKTLPKSTDGPSIQPGPYSFREFAAREGAPLGFKDFIYHDTPQLSLHITSFNDATLVAISWSHTLMDAMGRHALLQSWSLVLSGREAEVPPLLGAREDVVCAALDGPAEYEDFKLESMRLTGWAIFMFALRFVRDLLWNSVVETRTIFLPKGLMADLRSEAQTDIAVANGGEKSFVSDGDVLAAWATRAVAASLPRPRPITMVQALNARFRIPEITQATGVYIQNMVVTASTFLSADAARGPLGQIALLNRRHLMEQSTEGQILAYLRKVQAKSRPHGLPMLLLGESDVLLLPFTNWSKANFFKMIDFSGAVVRAGETGSSRKNPPGSIVYHHAQTLNAASVARNMFLVMGKDHGENYWITGLLLPRTWAEIETQLKAIL